MWQRWRKIWSSLSSFSTPTPRRLTTSLRRAGRVFEDEGDWRYAPEWWGTDSVDLGNLVFRENSDKENGVVSVLAYPSSNPVRSSPPLYFYLLQSFAKLNSTLFCTKTSLWQSAVYWPATERWLRQRFVEVNPSSKADKDDEFRVVGYQWRVLRFNDNTRQSTVKVMAACRASEPDSLFLAQQRFCLAVPYLKSMVVAGLTSLVSCGFDLTSAALGCRTMRVLCIGHGGGSLPLFLASNIQGANVDVVEIDPLVISASIQAMGFPSFSVADQSGQHCLSKPDMINEVLWKGIHERIFLYESDAEDFMLRNHTSDIYDLIFIDAYDGEDIFPIKLWDPQSPFLKALSDRLHPEHGTVVVNLHSDAEVTSSSGSVSSFLDPVLPMGRYISRVCEAYKDAVVGGGSGKQCGGLGFVVSAPWVCNTSLVVSRGFRVNGMFVDRDSVLNTLIMRSHEVESSLNLPFSCLDYIKRGFIVLD